MSFQDLTFLSWLQLNSTFLPYLSSQSSNNSNTNQLINYTLPFVGAKIARLCQNILLRNFSWAKNIHLDFLSLFALRHEALDELPQKLQKF